MALSGDGSDVDGVEYQSAHQPLWLPRVPAWPPPFALAPGEQADTQSRSLSSVCPLHTHLVPESREGPQTRCSGIPLPRSAMAESGRKGGFWEMRARAVASYVGLSRGDNGAYVPQRLSREDYTRSPAAVFSQSCCTLAAHWKKREDLRAGADLVTAAGPVPAN